MCDSGAVLSNVAVIALDGVAPFELGVLCEAFGVDREGVPSLDFAVCAENPGPVRSQAGFALDIEHGLERLRSADLIGIPAVAVGQPTSGAVLDALRAAHDRGVRLVSVCSGAFVLGEAGLLDDRECTTHWMHTADLARRFPAARVVPEVLYVDAGQVVTSAGTAAGIDACLHIWRQEYGAATAATIARRMVVPPQREGGQAQFIARPVVDCAADTLGPLLTWALDHLAEDLGVEALARRAHLSPRTFARRFRDETGTTPHAWVTAQRLRAAEELLESSSLSVEQIARRVGMANVATLRHQFQRHRGVSPQQYRRTFRDAAVG